MKLTRLRNPKEPGSYRRFLLLRRNSTKVTQLLSDVTSSALGHLPAYQGQLLRSTDHWRLRLPRNFGLVPAANHGLALGDVNGDDLDNDGDLDLYVANDFGRNCLYQNQGSKEGKLPFFVNIAAQLNIEDSSAIMSTNWGDFNRDGWMSLCVCNMFSSAGNRITYQKQFKPGTNQETLSTFQRMARGNTLFAANGKGGFTDVSEATHTTMARWCWGSTFADVSTAIGWDFTDDARAIALIDYDQDGDLDLLVTNRTAPRLRLLKNNLQSDSSFLSLHLTGTAKTTPREAIGTRVKIHLKDQPLITRTLHAGQSFLSQFKEATTTLNLLKNAAAPDSPFTKSIQSALEKTQANQPIRNPTWK